MKVYLCALAKNEHLYINEWVKHYLNLGVDKIFLFDNDDKNSPQVRDYIDKECLEKIRIINARGIHFDKQQHTFYSNFYNIEKDNFDWCIFCDIDEFLVGVDNIKTFLRNPKYSCYNQIRIKWKMFGDDNLIERDMTKGVMETFTKEVKQCLSKDLTHIVNLQDQGKMIVRGHLKNVVFHSPHFAMYSNIDNILRSCLPSGKECYSTITIHEDYSNENVFFNHYMTKTISEFIKQKVNRGDAVFGKRKIDLNYFWRINEKTKEKIKYLQDMGLE